MINNEDSSTSPVAGDGVTDVFQYDFPISKEEHLEVIVNDDVGGFSIKVLNVDYSVTGVGVEAGGTFTYPLAGDKLPVGYTIKARRNPPFTQEVDFSSLGGWNPERSEQVADTSTKQIQRLRDEIDDLATGEEANFLAHINTKGIHFNLYSGNEVPAASLGEVGDIYFKETASASDAATSKELHAAGAGAPGQTTITGGTDVIGDGGGGEWFWNPDRLKIEANLLTIIDPTVAFTRALQGTNPDPLAEGCWERNYDDAVNVHWAGEWAEGVSFADEIEAALDVAENLVLRVDVNPESVGSTANRNLFGGGLVVGQPGKIYTVDRTLQIPPRVTLSLSTIRADAGGSWPDIVGDGVDWIHVTEGGSDYGSAPAVTILGNQSTITDISKTNPAVVTAGNTYVDGETVELDDVVGMTEVNGERYLVVNASAAGFEISDLDGNPIDATGVGYTAYDSGGTATAGLDAAARAIVQNNAVIACYITNEGFGYTAAPTVTFAASTTTATGTAELITIGTPMIEEKTPDLTYTTFRPGLAHTTVDGNGVADGIHWHAVKNPFMDAVSIFNPKHVGLGYFGVDQSAPRDVSCYSSGKYGLYGSYNWTASTSTTSNENNFFGFRSKWSARAEVRTAVYTNNWTFHGGTCRQNVSDTPHGSEFILNSNGGGHSLLGMKLEHEGSNPNPVVITLGGAGHKLYFHASPNSPSVHYKWVHNLNANDVRIDMTCDKAVMNNRVPNPYSAGDISPFQSDASQGIRAIALPYTNDSRLESWLDWCRDMEGGNQGTGSKFLGLAYGSGADANNQLYRVELEKGGTLGGNPIASSDGTAVVGSGYGAGEAYAEVIIDGVVHKFLLESAPA